MTRKYGLGWQTGRAGESFYDGSSSPTAAIEVTPIENWLGLRRGSLHFSTVPQLNGVSTSFLRSLDALKQGNENDLGDSANELRFHNFLLSTSVAVLLDPKFMACHSRKRARGE